MFKRLVIFSCIFLFLVFKPNVVLAQSDVPSEETLEGKIINVLEEKKVEVEGQQPNFYQKLEILITEGSLKDKTINIEVGDIAIVNQPKYQKDDNVVVNYSQGLNGEDIFYITDYVRRSPLLWLFVIFVFLTVVISRWRGVSSLLGMALSFLVIFKYILPQISSGSDPIAVAIFGSIFIIPISFYLSHGFNKKTTIAILGTIIALVTTGILARVFVEAARLTGFASEEAGFLQVVKQGTMNIKGLLLAGIIIGVLGVLDDITISQSAIVFQLKEANKTLKHSELYKRAMDVGCDHITSMVNTLFLVYTGASLPLLLLFLDNSHPFTQVVNYEIVAEEIVRTLVGSIGLVLAVPITTLLAVVMIGRVGERE